jgi:hypothetical protein
MGLPLTSCVNDSRRTSGDVFGAAVVVVVGAAVVVVGAAVVVVGAAVVVVGAAVVVVGAAVVVVGAAVVVGGGSAVVVVDPSGAAVVVGPGVPGPGVPGPGIGFHVVGPWPRQWIGLRPSALLPPRPSVPPSSVPWPVAPTAWCDESSCDELSDALTDEAEPPASAWSRGVAATAAMPTTGRTGTKCLRLSAAIENLLEA